MKPLPKHGVQTVRERGPRSQRVVRYLTHDLWLKDVTDLPGLKKAAVKLSRLLVLAARGFHHHRALMQAAALTYYTILSIVPVLAVSFALARGLGAYEDLRTRTIEPFLDRFLSSQGETVAAREADEIPVIGPIEVTDTGEAVGGPADVRNAAERLLELVDETKPLALGLPGLALFLYSVIKLMSAVERSLNEVWGIRRGRSWARRISDYVAIVVITPILLLIGTAGMAAVRAVQKVPTLVGGNEIDISHLVGFVLQGVPFFTFFVGLTFAYLALPNTRVHLRSAMIGGAVAALAWLVSQYVFIDLQVGIAKYNALYAGFAAFPIFLVWTFLSWAIFLTGAELCYAHQSVPMFTSIARMGTVDQELAESLALRISGRVADAFLRGAPARDAADLASELGISPRAVNQVLERLVGHGILARTTDDEDRYLPARDPDAIHVLDVLKAMRTEDGAVAPTPRDRVDERVDRLLAGLEREARDSLHNHSLRELALSARSAEREEDAPARAASEAPDAAGA